MKRIMLAALAAIFASAAAAQAAPPTLGQWLARQRALAAQGPLDQESAAFKALYADLATALAAGRAAHNADLAAGRPPAACLPPQGQSQLDWNTVNGWLRARPEAEQTQSLNEVIGRFLREKFPCPR
jgi:hypothetical protein